MRNRESEPRSAPHRIALAALTLALPATLACAAFASAEPGDNSAATITGSFADSCRDFSAHSSKDISHVVIHYADGRVVKDESTTTPDYSIDGDPGDEIASAIVKSGTTIDKFACQQQANTPPTAVLEVKAPEGCFTWPDGVVDCDGRVARTTWTRSFVTSLGFGLVRFYCELNDPSCVDRVNPCGEKDFYPLCITTYIYRGTSSTDPDNDIVTWELDFGDGTSTGPQSWTTNPPTEVLHEFQIHECPTCSRQPATLTVTDSAGQSSSDSQLVAHQRND